MAKLIFPTVALFISKAQYICSKTQENELVKRSVTLFESKRATLLQKLNRVLKKITRSTDKSLHALCSTS